jgi:alcohol dehydrogenase (cytochrome c)
MGWLISLDAKTGTERCKKQIADPKMQYFTTTAPMVVGNHIIVGVGGHATNLPAFLGSRDPQTGELLIFLLDRDIF